MKRLREEGACYAYSKSDGGAYLFPRSEYPRLKSEWMAGKAFFEGAGFYGSTVIIKLGDVVAIMDENAEALTAHREDKAQNDREDAL